MKDFFAAWTVLVFSAGVLCTCGGGGGQDTYSINGTVTLGSVGYGGVTITLRGDAAEDTATDNSGNYTFTGLGRGNYTVTPDLPGQTFTPPSRNVDLSGSSMAGVDFSLDTYILSGQVTNSMGGMPGIRVNLGGTSAGSVMTESGGDYIFSGLLNGLYTATPVGAPQVFDPVSSLVTVSGSHAENVDFNVPSMVWLVDIDEAGTGNGYSWVNAFDHPQDAMDIAFPGDQIWVAEGTYYPRDTEDTYVLSLADGVAVYGGFAGLESGLWQRDWTQNETVLDGNGLPSPEGYRQVIVANADEALVDGFTITGGVDNFTSYFSGIGINTSTSETIHASFINSLIIGNFGGESAPGVYIDASPDSIITFKECEISDNQGAWSFATIAIVSGNVVFTGCDIFGNSVFEGTGGILIDSGANVVIENSFVENNACTGQAGAGGIETRGDLSLINDVIAGNSTAVNSMGGGIEAWGGVIFMVNTTIVNNQVGTLSGGGGIYVGGSAVDIVNGILWENTKSAGNGGGILVDSQIEGEPRSVAYSDVMGGWAGTMNIDGDPAFASSTDFYLTEGSPCIDAGTAEGAPPEDIEGNPRPVGAGYDMGAFEYIP